MTQATSRDDEIDHDERTIDDLRVLIKEIKQVWLACDRQIIPDAERALLRLLHEAGARYRKQLAGDEIVRDDTR